YVPTEHRYVLNEQATPRSYTLSLHDALPISRDHQAVARAEGVCARREENGATDVTRAGKALQLGRLQIGGDGGVGRRARVIGFQDRKSTRLNSSHDQISYAVFCLKKKTWCRT